MLLNSGKNIYYLGELSYSDIPSFLNALNVGIILNKEDAFGMYCFPQKFYEMVSCEVPIAVSRVGVMSRMLSKTPQILFQPDDIESLSNVLEKQINEPVLVKNKVLEWAGQGKILASLIESSYVDMN